MKDIPMFTTENGIGALTLRQIPYTGRAYVRILDSRTPEDLLAECVDFCKFAGAKQIFATGSEALEAYPLYAEILTMRCDRLSLPDTNAALWPVQEQTLELWKQIYNQKAVKIPAAAWMSDKECKEMLEAGEGYFVHRDGDLLGTGRIREDKLLWVASCAPGAGKAVVCALAHACFSDVVQLDVARQNHKAMALYSALGFVCAAPREDWHCVFDSAQYEK